MRTIMLTLFLVAIGFVAQVGHSYPKASDRAERWQLRLDTGDLRFYRDTETGAGYWLLIYEVTNETKEDHRWTPQFDLVTDKGEILSGGDNVPRTVQLRILDIFWDPLMQSQSDASGTLLQGKENAIRSVVIWKAGHEDVREIQVFAAGVSGDTAEVIHPVTGDTKKLRRVIQLSWVVDGGIDQIILKPLPKSSVGNGTNVRRLDTTTKDRLRSNEVYRKWIFR